MFRCRRVLILWGMMAWAAPSRATDAITSLIDCWVSLRGVIFTPHADRFLGILQDTDDDAVIVPHDREPDFFVFMATTRRPGDRGRLFAARLQAPAPGAAREVKTGSVTIGGNTSHPRRKDYAKAWYQWNFRTRAGAEKWGLSYGLVDLNNRSEKMLDVQENPPTAALLIPQVGDEQRRVQILEEVIYPDFRRHLKEIRQVFQKTKGRGNHVRDFLEPFRVCGGIPALQETARSEEALLRKDMSEFKKAAESFDATTHDPSLD